MSPQSDSLAALRDRAVAGAEDLIGLFGVARGLGIDVPTDDDVRRPLIVIGQFDVAGLSADAHRLSAVHRAVADQWNRLSEQQLRLDQGWISESGAVAIARVAAHRRTAEADLRVLRTFTEATTAASAGIDRMLRTWYLTVARLSSPVVAGVPVPELPPAILAGRVPLPIVVADIASRVTLFRTTAAATVAGVETILNTLNRATDDLGRAAITPGDQHPGLGGDPRAPGPLTGEHGPRTPAPAPVPAPQTEHAPQPATPDTSSQPDGESPSPTTPSTPPQAPAPQSPEPQSPESPTDGPGPGAGADAGENPYRTAPAAEAPRDSEPTTEAPRDQAPMDRQPSDPAPTPRPDADNGPRDVPLTLAPEEIGVAPRHAAPEDPGGDDPGANDPAPEEPTHREAAPPATAPEPTAPEPTGTARGAGPDSDLALAGDQ